ncbi:jg2201, partial [Pararge aegeria aegeria]
MSVRPEHHKRHFITPLVEPFLEVSFLCDEEVRNTTIPLFFDMMQTEFQHTSETEHHKRHFITPLVEPFLEVSFLCDEEVRNTTIPLFFDMMQTEFQHTSET